MRNWRNMDEVLFAINSQFICWPADEESKNNRILHDFLHPFLNLMKGEDSLFGLMFDKVFYGGSYYDGLRITRPNEFDLDLLLDLSKLVDTEFTRCDLPGFVNLRVNAFTSKSVKYPNEQKKFRTLLDRNNFLSVEKTLSWMHGIVRRALNKLGTCPTIETDDGTFEVTMSTSGPAFTIHIWADEPYWIRSADDDYTDPKEVMSIDLVPCFSFDGHTQWPYDVIRNPTTWSEFFIVPKPIKRKQFTAIINDDEVELCWRLSFQGQERKIMAGKGQLKSAIRLLKKLRNRYHHDFIASYFIKTVVLHMAYRMSPEFWQKSLSYVFLAALQEYRKCLSEGKILFFWNRKYNLIGHIGRDTLINCSNLLGSIIDNVIKHPEKPVTVAQYLLSVGAYNKFGEFPEYIPESANYVFVYDEDEENENRSSNKQSQSSCAIL